MPLGEQIRNPEVVRLLGASARKKRKYRTNVVVDAVYVNVGIQAGMIRNVEPFSELEELRSTRMK